MSRFKASLLVVVLPCSSLLFAHPHSHTHSLDTLIISSPGQGKSEDIAQPIRTLDQQAIQANSGDTLGSLLEKIPGIANASFGPGVGRPVIRGMSGSRVKILQNGSDAADTSAMSSDHAHMGETTAAERIEILYGPSTLLYGGGAIGGVVNLLDQRIHESPLKGLYGHAGIRFSSHDRGHNTHAALNAGNGNWVLHLDAFQRDADDYQSGQGRISNSDSSGQGGAVALSRIGRQGFMGASISWLDYDYAVPNPAGNPFRVVPQQVRYDFKGAWRPLWYSQWNWIDEWRTELSFNDYIHAETEPGLDVGLFDQESWELRSHIRHHNLGSWQGTLGVQLKQQTLALCHNHSGCQGIPSFSSPWNGEMGYNLSNRLINQHYFSHDTPMPTTETRQAGLFLVEQRDWALGKLELGVRLDHIRIQSDPDPIQQVWRQNQDYYQDRSFNPATFSAAATWVLTSQQRLGFNLARVQRAPEAFEIFWNGDHHATFSFQLDNPELDLETAYTLDVNWLYRNTDHQLRLTAFYYHFDDYIYNDLKPFKDPFHGHDVYRHEQVDARFYGAEFSWHYWLDNNWHLDVDADLVRAERLTGEKLPRTPPASLLFALEWHQGDWITRLESRMVMAQKQTAQEETASDGFVVLNASAGYQQLLSKGEIYWHLALHNITDEYAINHVSYLKRAAPLPGRNLQAGMRWQF